MNKALSKLPADFEIVSKGWPGYAPQFDDGGDARDAFCAGFRGLPIPHPEFYRAYDAGKRYRVKWDATRDE